MRPRLATLIALVLALGSYQPAVGAPDNPAEKRRERDFWWNTYMPTPARKERSAEQQKFQPSYSETMAARLGVVDGKARIFKVDLDSSSNSSRAIEGALDGNGVKVRFKW